jgi:hypothetical protein
MAPAGLAAAIGGYFIGINAIGIGLLTGGIVCSVYGHGSYWGSLPAWARFVGILAGLSMLLFIGTSYLGVSWRNRVDQSRRNGWKPPSIFQKCALAAYGSPRAPRAIAHEAGITKPRRPRRPNQAHVLK